MNNKKKQTVSAVIAAVLSISLFAAPATVRAQNQEPAASTQNIIQESSSQQPEAEKEAAPPPHAAGDPAGKGRYSFAGSNPAGKLDMGEREHHPVRRHSRIPGAPCCG